MPATLPRRARHCALGLTIAITVVMSLLAAAPASAQVTPGIQTHLLWSGVDGAALNHDLDRAQEAGAKMIRADLGWSSLEQNAKGRYESWYLDKVDRLVSETEARGIKLLLTVTETPCWASSAPDELKQGCAGSWWSRGVQSYAPSNPNDYAATLAFLVARYGDRVAGWEIWNEPNSKSFFKAADPQASYAALVKAAYPAAKAAHPSATILAGALSEANYAWAEALYAHGIKGNFDAFSIHPYAGDASPLDPLTPQWTKNSFAAGVPAVREVLLRHGDDKPIWLTEFGWSTSTIRNSEPWANGVSEQTQADYTALAFEQARSWSYVPVAIVYELRDWRDDPSDRESNFGLLRHDDSAKPAFAAFRRAADAAGSGAPSGGGSTGSGTGTGSGSGSGAGGGGKKGKGGKSSRRGLWLRVRRDEAGVSAHGRMRANLRDRYRRRLTHVLLRTYSFSPSRGRFSRYAAFDVRLRVRSSGRFSVLLDPRVASGRWRVTATATRAHGSQKAASAAVRLR